jgi:hypothetical protein
LRHAHALPVGRDHTDRAEVVAEPRGGDEDVVGGAVQRPLPLEVRVPRVDQRPRIHGERAAGADADDQARLVGHALPAVDLEPEVELVQEVVERLLQLQQRLVRRVRLHRGTHAPGDQPLENVRAVLAGIGHGASSLP